MKRIFIPALFAMFLAAPAAYASHYDLADIDIVPAETVDTLAKNKVETTEQLLALLLKKSDRAAFAKQYNLDAANVELIAHKLELMQVVGIGPKAAAQIILDLKGKLVKTDEKGRPEAYEEVASALKSLGFKKADIDRALSSINEPNLDNAALLRLALRQLRKE